MAKKKPPAVDSVSARGAARSEPAGPTIDTLPIEKLRSNVQAARALLAQLEALLPGLVSLPDTDRRHSDGRFRDGESDVLRSLIGLCEKSPQYFAVLADRDQGSDPNRLETQLLRERLERRDLLDGLSNELAPLLGKLSDSVLSLGELTRPVLLAVYQIAKPLAQHDAKIRTALSDAMNFYSRPARRAAETRAARRKSDPNAK